MLSLDCWSVICELQGVQAESTAATGPAGIVNAALASHLTVNSAGVKRCHISMVS